MSPEWHTRPCAARASQFSVLVYAALRHCAQKQIEIPLSSQLQLGHRSRLGNSCDGTLKVRIAQFSNRTEDGKFRQSADPMLPHPRRPHAACRPMTRSATRENAARGIRGPINQSIALRDHR